MLLLALRPSTGGLGGIAVKKALDAALGAGAFNVLLPSPHDDLSHRLRIPTAYPSARVSTSIIRHPVHMLHVRNA